MTDGVAASGLSFLMDLFGKDVDTVIQVYEMWKVLSDGDFQFMLKMYPEGPFCSDSLIKQMLRSIIVEISKSTPYEYRIKVLENLSITWDPNTQMYSTGWKTIDEWDPRYSKDQIEYIFYKEAIKDIYK